MSYSCSVLVVGAGPSGLGCATALKVAGVPDVAVIDAHGVGSSFESWPRQMRLLTPSFHSNAFGAVDLNAVTPDTSPADFLRTEHLSGPDYAKYLKAVAIHFELNVLPEQKVLEVQPQPGGGFLVRTDQDEVHAEMVIWAAGQFVLPSHGGIEGADLCLHSSAVLDWDQVCQQGDRFTVIGGYESGVDAAIELMQRGAEVSLLSDGEPWVTDDADPSRCLSPRTRDRLKAALLESEGQIEFLKEARITAVERDPEGGFLVRDGDGVEMPSDTAPILATGYRHALEPIRDLWEWKEGRAVFTEEADESTLTPGLFYSGPSLTHRGMLFCFIYKFRARFAVVAREIASRLGIDASKSLALWKERGFMLEDLSCCTDCACAVAPAEEDQPLEEVHA